MKLTLKYFLIFCLNYSITNAKIIYPKTDDFPTDCKTPDGSKGSCRNLRYCPAAITAKKVKSCYFEGNDEYVCCKENVWDDFTTLPFTANCGKQEPRFEITVGYKTQYKEFSYMVALGWKSQLFSGKYEYKCGGVLISDKYVLTAAHCAVLNGLVPDVALVGGTNLTDNASKKIPIAEVKIHIGYKPKQSYHDIALIRLKKRSNEIPICIWGSYVLDEINVTAIGYGHTAFGGHSSDSLLKAYLQIISNDECSKHYTGELYLPYGVVETQICAKDPEEIRDTCQGDSGGPLILFATDNFGVTRPFVVGITSFGKACALEYPGIYTRVSEYINWVEQIVFNI